MACSFAVQRVDCAGRIRTMGGTQDPEQLLPFRIQFRRQGMLRTLIASGLLAVLCVSSVQADEELADIDKQATHSQTRTIEIQEGDKDKMTVNVFLPQR